MTGSIGTTTGPSSVTMSTTFSVETSTTMPPMEHEPVITVFQMEKDKPSEAKKFDIVAFVNYHWDNHFAILMCVVVIFGCVVGLMLAFTIIGCISCCKLICKRRGSYNVNPKKELVKSVSYKELADKEAQDDLAWHYADCRDRSVTKRPVYHVEKSPTPIPPKRVKVMVTDDDGNIPPYVLRSRTSQPMETTEQPTRVRVVEREIPRYKTQMSININKETAV